MTEKLLKMRIHEHLHRRYKTICASMGLSMSKQNTELIRKFVEVQEENIRLMGK
jgi:antitoxin component of RelBE/YafQ-DinJ toxin-antitoxin module